MKKPNVMKFAKSKRFKYGSYATIITVVVIAIAILLNVVVSMLEGSMGWRFDLTKNQMFSLSEQTTQTFKKLNQDVKIYSLFQAGREDAMMEQVLAKYRAGSSHITVENVDPVKNPTFVEKFDKEKQGINPGSVIVTNKDESRFKVLSQLDLYGYNTNTQTVDTFQAEQKLTGALLYVTSDKTPIVYFLQGHQEKNVDSDLSFLKSLLADENYAVGTFNFLNEDQVLNPGDTLVIAGPKKDLSMQERDKLKDFLGNGGKVMFLFDPMKEDMPNFESLLKLYDVTMDKDVVIEGDQGHYYQNPAILVPDLQSSDITSPLISGKLSAVLPAARSLKVPAVKKSDIDVVPLIKSSDNSWGKTNLEATSVNKEDGDMNGPFVLGLSIEKKNFEDESKSARMVVFGSSQFISSSDVASLSGNIDLFMNSLNWMRNEKDSITIRPKSLASEQLKITDYSQALILAGLVILVIPILIFGAGTVVWLRRKHL